MKNKILLMALTITSIMWADFDFGEFSGSKTFQQEIIFWNHDNLNDIEANQAVVAGSQNNSLKAPLKKGSHTTLEIQNITTNQFHLQSIKNIYTSAEPLVFEVTHAPTNDNMTNWIAIFLKNKESKESNVARWRFMNSTKKSNSVGISNGKVTIDDNALPEGDYEARFFLNNSYDLIKSTSFKIRNSVNTSFQKIQALIQHAKKEQNNDIPYTYVCVGDSTRALSTFPSGVEGEYLFYELRNNLSAYGVKSVLHARHGHRLEQLLDESEYPRISQVIDAIPNNGTHAIVDISLGINDVLAKRPKETIKEDLKRTIQVIKDARPETNFMLTTPSRNLSRPVGTQMLRDIYHEVSNELNIPLNSVIDSLMPTEEATDKSWYRDEDKIHLSRKGEHNIAQFILSNILSDKKPFPTHNDSNLIYHNNELNVEISQDKKNVIVTRIADGKVMWSSAGGEFFQNIAGTNVEIKYTLHKRKGGVDIKYIITNKSVNTQKMPILKVPGIKLMHTDNLNILNNYRLYIENRKWDENLNSKNNYYVVGSHIGHYTNNESKEVFYDADIPYGNKTNGLYAPVILAHDKDFAVGTSLNYPFLDYESGVASKKLYPYTRIYKDVDDWRYEYSFDKSSTLPEKKTYHMTIPVRFSRANNALLTLYPYKDHFQYLYRTNEATLDKDTSPSLFTIWAFTGNDSPPKNPRGWNWAFVKMLNGVATMPLLEVGRGLKYMMQEKGYKHILLNSFSGVYRIDNDQDMNGELPFEFITKHEEEDKLQDFFSIFHEGEEKQKYSFWWGISSMIPMQGNSILGNDDWSPSSDVHYDYGNKKHRTYAQKHFNSAIKNHADGLSFDAYIRMETKGAIAWLDEIKRKISPNTKMTLELNQDIYHSRGAIFLQPTNKGLVKDDNKIMQTPILAQYLNPNAEVQVFMQNRFYADTLEEEKYMKELVKMGYTPQIVINNNGLADSGNSNDIEQRIKNGGAFFLDVNGLDNSIIYECFDGKDNDGDGKIDWPYDLECTSAMDNE